MNADSAAAPSLPQLPSKDGAAPPPLPAASEGETAVALAELPASPAENATKKAPEPQMAANDAPLVPALPTPPASAPLAPAAPVATPAAVSPTPSAAHGPAPALRILFSETETDIPLTINAQLDALAHTLTSNPTSRITIMAYASGPEQSGIYPKRVALARGIAVRNYLTTNKGIDIERVNVKAMGNKNDEGGPADRVDVFVLK
jgi:outer membrane protein OmpA-like peptidoglycan-associated protein